MKKLFILLLLAVSATANAANTADNDTLTILKPKRYVSSQATLSRKLKSMVARAKIIIPTRVRFCW